MTPVQNQTLYDLITKKPVATGGVLVLGNFDGVHIGHKAVIDVALKEAKRLGTTVDVLTFEPHPYALFKEDGIPFLLTSPERKNKLLHEVGAQRVITLAFTRSFSTLSAKDFIEKILVEACQARHVVVGFDFVFGSGRGGDREALRKGLAQHDIGMSEVAPIRDEGNEIISSSRIRSFIKKGEMEKAARLLGRPYLLEGIIQKGDQRGRQLSFPTANIMMDQEVRPAYGSYVVYARKMGDKDWIEGIANIGIRPTIGNKKELLEFHLFGVDHEFYGEKWEVALLHHLRPEKAFANLDELKQQITADKTQAKDYFKTHFIKGVPL